MNERSWSNCLWVILGVRRTLNQAPRYQPMGPFTHQEVLELIYRGDLAFHDYVWRSGFDSWKPISQIKEFAPRSKECAPEHEEVAAVAESLDVVDLRNIADHVFQKPSEQPPAKEKPTPTRKPSRLAKIKGHLGLR